jgi:hypothetical protein
VRSLTTFLAANDMPGEIDDVTTESICAFLVAERERTTPAYAQQFGVLELAHSEGERAGENLMTRRGGSGRDVPSLGHLPGR